MGYYFGAPLVTRLLALSRACISPTPQSIRDPFYCHEDVYFVEFVLVLGKAKLQYLPFLL